MLRSCVIAPLAQAPYAPVAKTDSKVRASQTWHWVQAQHQPPTAPAPSFSWTNPSGTHSANLPLQPNSSAVIERSLIITRLWMNELWLCGWSKRCCSHFCVRINWIIYFVEWPSCWLDFHSLSNPLASTFPPSAEFIIDFVVICSLITVKKRK